MKYNDLSDKKFGKLTVIEINGRNGRGFLLWRCQCECGEQIDVTADHLKSGNTQSCGCLTKSVIRKPKHDYTKYFNTKINKLTILGFGSKNKYDRLTFTCQCDCGVIKDIEVTKVINNRVISCGCFRIEVVKLITGSKHHNWNNEKSQEQRNRDKEYRKDKDWEYIKWRKFVFERDEYTCQICGVVGGRLQAHHLNCWALFENQRLDLTNGITLCNFHHKEFHKLFGLKTTRQMFEEYESSVN